MKIREKFVRISLYIIVIVVILVSGLVISNEVSKVRKINDTVLSVNLVSENSEYVSDMNGRLPKIEEKLTSAYLENFDNVKFDAYYSDPFKTNITIIGYLNNNEWFKPIAKDPTEDPYAPYVVIDGSDEYNWYIDQIGTLKFEAEKIHNYINSDKNVHVTLYAIDATYNSMPVFAIDDTGAVIETNVLILDK